MFCTAVSWNTRSLNICASPGAMVTYLQLTDGLPGLSLCSSLVGSALVAQGKTLTCLINSALLYGLWRNCILQLCFATWLVKLLMNDWPKQTFIYAAAFVSFQNGKMKRSLYSTFNFVTTCDVLFHFLFAIPYPKRCCDHDNPHSTVVSYS